MKFASNIRELIKQGISINEIRRRTGAAKSTIYYHYKRIKGKKTKPVVFNFKNMNELGEFLGMFAGDGYCCIGRNYHYIIKIVAGAYETGYRKYLKKQLPNWFGKKPLVFCARYKGRPSWYVYTYYSKEIYGLIKKHLEWEGKKTYTVRLKKIDFDNKLFNTGFLRGLVDTDGNYYAPKHRVSYSTASPKLSQQAYQLMALNCGVYPSHYVSKKPGRADLHTLTLHGKEARSFLETIKPNNPNKAPVI